MLGDTGSNALGALLGLAATRLGRGPRLAVLAGLAGLNAASEVVSFTKVIARTPALNRLDMLGRRPAPAKSAGSAEGTVSGGVVSEPAKGSPGADGLFVPRQAGSSSNGVAADPA